MTTGKFETFEEYNDREVTLTSFELHKRIDLAKKSIEDAEDKYECAKIWYLKGVISVLQELLDRSELKLED